MLADEGVQHAGDDPAGVAPGHAHVREPDVRRVAVERVTDQVEVGPGHRHQDGFTGVEAGTDERQGAGDVVVRAGVEQSLVHEGARLVGHLRRGDHRRRAHSLSHNPRQL